MTVGEFKQFVQYMAKWGSEENRKLATYIDRDTGRYPDRILGQFTAHFQLRAAYPEEEGAQLPWKMLRRAFLLEAHRILSPTYFESAKLFMREIDDCLDRGRQEAPRWVNADFPKCLFATWWLEDSS